MQQSIRNDPKWIEKEKKKREKTRVTCTYLSQGHTNMTEDEIHLLRRIHVISGKECHKFLQDIRNPNEVLEVPKSSRNYNYTQLTDKREPTFLVNS